MTPQPTPWRFAPLLAAPALAALLLAAPANAQTAVGDWHGALAAAPGVTLRVGVSIAAGRDGALSGVLTSPDQSPDAIPIEGIKLEGARLSFTSDIINGRFDATWDPATQSWTGVWTQGATLPLTLLKGKVVAGQP